MNFETLILQQDQHLATVTLNRPEVRNAFNETSILEIGRVFAQLSEDASVRAVVLAANGPAFCAGADLNWMKKMASYSHAENHADAGQLATMLRNIYLCNKPVIAKVQGDCYAGGMGLVTACDIIVAQRSVNFCLSEVRLGLIPATISPYVIKAMGEQAARRYFVTAERFDAHKALQLGMVHEIAEDAGQLDEITAGIVKNLIGNSPNAVLQAKRLVREVAGQSVSDALLADTAQRIADIRASSEGREGVLSFLEKRKPSWLTA
jgi:methylglutaconyl-CoA hydratase